VITHVSCNAGNNGSVDITPTGGTGAYTYAWTGGTTTQDISTKIAGSYNVTITDANACTASASYSITQPLVLAQSGVVTNLSCNGGNNGAVNITVSGGTATYTYTWNSGAITEDISGRTNGTYTLTITDSKGCTTSGSYAITQPSAVSTTGVITHVSCNAGNNGSVDITPAGGTGAYTYAWTGGITTQDISTKIAGSYNVTISDANACTASASYVITQPVASISVTNSITHVNCNAGNNGAVDITPVGGTGAYTYAWTGGTTAQDISSKIAGTYNVTISDANA
jgi:erythromycin esterase-like protein